MEARDEGLAEHGQSAGALLGNMCSQHGRQDKPAGDSSEQDEYAGGLGAVVQDQGGAGDDPEAPQEGGVGQIDVQLDPVHDSAARGGADVGGVGVLQRPGQDDEEEIAEAQHGADAGQQAEVGESPDQGWRQSPYGLARRTRAAACTHGCRPL